MIYRNGNHFSTQKRPATALHAFLFGHHISHSFAPQMHHALWKSVGIPWTFALVDSMEVNECINRLQSESCVGCSITMPHKLRLMSWVNELTEEARMIGAINTIYVRKSVQQGRRMYIGTNTDCIGIWDAFEMSFSGSRRQVEGMPAMVIGAGGAARAAIYALWKFFNVHEIYIVNRLASETDELIRTMSLSGCAAHIRDLTHVSNLSPIEAPAMAVGTVPDLPARTREEQQVQSTVLELLKKRRCGDAHREGFLLDMCYHPHPVTRLIELARSCGWHTVSGLEVLKYQGIAQNRLWSQREMSVDAAEIVGQAIREGLEARKKDAA